MSLLKYGAAFAPNGIRTLAASSGRRDSNSRPQPWQGCALPTELFPQCEFDILMPKNRPSSDLLSRIGYFAVTSTIILHLPCYLKATQAAVR